MPLASSTVMTPSLPTFCIASAIIWPISASPLAEIVPTCAVSAWVVIFLLRFFSSSTSATTALSTPRFRSIGFMPAETALPPSRTMACASTIAVVVPSPATSLVFEATSRTICAPMFSNLSESSISLATRHAILGDARCAIALVQDHVATLRTERDLHRLGEYVDATQHALTGIIAEPNVFRCHLLILPEIDDAA